MLTVHSHLDQKLIKRYNVMKTLEKVHCRRTSFTDLCCQHHEV